MPSIASSRARSRPIFLCRRRRGAKAEPLAAYHRRLWCLSKQRKCDEISGAWQPFNPLASHTQIARGRCSKHGCAGRIPPSGRIEGGPLLHYRSDTHRCRMSAPMGTTQSRRVDPRPAALLFERVSSRRHNLAVRSSPIFFYCGYSGRPGRSSVPALTITTPRSAVF